MYLNYRSQSVLYVNRHCITPKDVYGAKDNPNIPDPFTNITLDYCYYVEHPLGNVI